MAVAAVVMLAHAEVRPGAFVGILRSGEGRSRSRQPRSTRWSEEAERHLFAPRQILTSKAHPSFRAKGLVVLEELEALLRVVSGLLRFLEANLMPSELSEAVPRLQSRVR